jgi:flavin reductase (DIM6/NTAB) family NADH-FMN oxidoreductase RutF
MREVSPSKAYRLLESGPVVLVTTAAEGRANVMTMGFHMVLQHDPPLLACSIGSWDYSYQALTGTGQCVIAVPGADLATKVVDIGNCSGSDVDKFKRFRLTALPAKQVAAPLIGECLANLECEVADTTLVEAYQLFVLRVVAISVNDARKERRLLHHNGDGTFTLDGRTLDLRERMVLWKSYQVDV